MDIVLSPSLKLDSLSSFPFSSLPTFRQVDESFGDIIFTTQSSETDHREATQATKDMSTSPNVPASGKKTGSTARPRRRRSLRKDRHSKIRTAQGVRDRRMRLSLDVAPEFFDIQDKLGFDKASKTLRWLITAARPAVEELIAASRPETMATTNSRGSSSKSSIRSLTPELESGDMNSTASDKGKSAAPPVAQQESEAAPKAKRVRRHLPATIARESRLKARARARERTEKKSLMQSSFDQFPAVAVREDSSLDQLVAEVEEHCSQSPNNQRELLGSGTGRSDHELGVTIFDYNQSLMCPIDTTVSLFHEQWDMERILQTWEA